MKRLILSALTVTGLLALGGCVLTPAYQYSGGSDGYYYGQSPYAADQTVIYGSAGPVYYNDPWYTPYAWGPGVSTNIYYYSGGHRRYRYGDHDRHDHRYDGDRRRYDHDGDRDRRFDRHRNPAPQYRQSNRLGARGVELMHRQQQQNGSTSSRRSDSRNDRRRHR
ncbi:hypothetical protein [Oleiagrimonas soli]|uniref:Lipoprotein n=1 Tax=Oleiagrimonas soli TaxID=1543381 RepID=A0A841KIA7_9GAMM|nr:hypothetical protein [Oleiagrimonas soli]MBB6184916.1 hypothetical protein [Oleiagrimonas soli]